MPITRKPTEEPLSQGSSQSAYEAYLHKGGSAAQAAAEELRDVRFTLQVPGLVCQRLDNVRRRRPVKTSRHYWVLEAIMEKLQREDPVDGMP